MTLFAPFAEVPYYPLVFPLFWGAAAIFVLAMARHLRVFAAARVEGPSPFSDITRRFIGLIQYAFIQTKMFKDWRAGLMHAGIFWGFVLLTIGTVNVVTGGIVEQVLSIPFDGALWAVISAMQNIVAVIVLVSIGWAFVRRLVTKPRRLTYNRDALIILSMIGGVVLTELLAETFEFAVHGDEPGAFVSTALAGVMRSTFSTATNETLFAVFWWAHIALVAAFLIYLPVQQAPPHRHQLPEHLVPQAATARRAAADGPGGRERDVRAQVAAGPRLEGPARRVHLHGMRPLPRGLSGLEHREAAQSEDVHHGHPGHVGRSGARAQPHPELAHRA
jgi:hypothetical protein